MQTETDNILKAPTPAALRDELERLVLLDLLGPAAGPSEEVNEASVQDRYLVGMLAPCYKQIMPEELDELALADGSGNEDGTNEQSVLNTVTLSPSSVGMSFCVALNATALRLQVHWGRYKRMASETLQKATGTPEMVWKRQQMGGEQIISLKVGTLTPWSPEPEEQPEIQVQGIIRRSAACWTISLFLVNGQREPKRLRDEAWIFQPQLIVAAPDLQPIFQRRTPALRQHPLQEEQTMAMLYRQFASFASGHSISTHVEIDPANPTQAFRISTSVVPRYDVPRTEAPTDNEITGLAGCVLDMKELSESSALDIVPKLTPLVSAYETWIAEQWTRIADPETGLSEFTQVAENSIEACRQTLERIRAGITLLKTDRQALQAFTFMNKAMYLQRIHAQYAEEIRRGHQTTLAEKDLPANRSWRPFQLAFILLNIPALTDLHHSDRSTDASAIADLLWFPTGGGKTEAYLGLTAYTLAIRRLQGVIEGRAGEEGIAVIMRYTLRLLTLQQFQRAAALICACEVLRRQDPQGLWGSTPFRLGLWVGQRTTPNTTEQSEEASKQDRGLYQPHSSAIGGIGSPYQLTNCPWCGKRLDAGRDITVERFTTGRGRTLIYCSDSTGTCEFGQRKASGEGLPVLVVDEEIYRLLPALLIATVDKFAQMPWNGATQMLFGLVDKKCSRHGFRSPDLEDSDFHRATRGLPAARTEAHRPLRPPDLIIQDELHLISGPLGTLVGLYEAVVDRLSTWEVHGQRIRPKVVAATATIRRASQQVEALFMRQVQIFPPNGLDVDDNFFARQRPPSETRPGRRYIGICANGRRLKAALIRVYVAFLSASQYLYQTYGQIIDPWMTLVGYFNSMNELGGMRRLVEDEVRSRLSKMQRRGMAQRHAPYLEELTSRKSSTDIPRVLDLLERVFEPGEQNKQNPLRPLDVLLATNMVSVGVDVKRLGLMVVTGQPKTTAEYIQATSRVGRSQPGLVCVVFNWSRPRDLSHYEKFAHYHATFYQQVEALSITPFAPRAIDRGLAALLVSYIRLLGSEFNANSQAGMITGNHPYFAAAIDEIAQRAITITHNPAIGQAVRAELEMLKEYWLNQIAHMTGATLGYKTRKDGRTIGLLRPPGGTDWTPFTCLNSLRDVEPAINLLLDDRGLGDHSEKMVEDDADNVL